MTIYQLLELVNDAKAIQNGDGGKRIVRRVVWRYGTKLLHAICRALRVQ